MEYDKVIGGHPKCPKMEMLEQAVNDDPEILKVVKNNEWVFQYLTNETGMNVTCMKHIDYIFDALFIEKVAMKNISKLCLFFFFVFVFGSVYDLEEKKLPQHSHYKTLKV